MNPRKILICGDPALRRKAKRVREIDDDVRRLLDEMVECMLQAPGIGLAAPQIGEDTRCIVARDQADEEEERIYRIVNPRVQARTGQQTGMEGCLSLPTLQAEVTRPERIVVTGQDEHGRPVKLTAEGMLARCLLHEIDHLDGVLFLDRADPDTIGWLIPDEDEEDGYRIKAATVPEVMAAFDRLRQRQQEREQQQQAIESEEDA